MVVNCGSERVGPRAHWDPHTFYPQGQTSMAHGHSAKHAQVHKATVDSVDATKVYEAPLTVMMMRAMRDIWPFLKTK